MQKIYFIILGLLLAACSAAPESNFNPIDLNKNVPSYKKDTDKDEDLDGDDDEDEDEDDDHARGLWGFGGMYSLSGYNNPATGSTTCPGGYESVQILGSPEEDAGLYYCKRNLTEDENPIYFFGGFYGYHFSGVYENPLTGSATCPTGFQSYKVYGYEVPSMNFKDYELYFCAKTPAANETWEFGFGGFFGEGRNEDYKHAQTSGMNCPANHTQFPILGSSNADWPAYVCLEPLTDSAEFVNIDAPPANIEFDPIFDRGLVAFGGMYSLWPDGTPGHPNPAMAGTSNPYSCPAGYLSKKVYGTPQGVGGTGWRADWSLFICYKETQGLFETAVYDFGGMYSLGGDSSHWNMFTGHQNCPNGFQAAKVLERSGHDYAAYFCYRTQERDQETPYSFGGLYSDGPGDGYLNPLTNTRACPTDHDYQNGGGKRILYRNYYDRPLYFCGAEIN